MKDQRDLLDPLFNGAAHFIHFSRTEKLTSMNRKICEAKALRFKHGLYEIIRNADFLSAHDPDALGFERIERWFLAIYSEEIFSNMSDDPRYSFEHPAEVVLFDVEGGQQKMHMPWQ